MRLLLHPLTLREANQLVKELHRHHRPPQGALFAVGIAWEDAEKPCGCAIVGRPVARLMDNGWTAEVVRLATDGSKNACSMLYGACWRAAKAMGYRRLITYTLATEPGTSLLAVKWKCLGEAGGGTWNRRERPRVDTHPTQMKLLWEAV